MSLTSSGENFLNDLDRAGSAIIVNDWLQLAIAYVNDQLYVNYSFLLDVILLSYIPLSPMTICYY